MLCRINSTKIICCEAHILIIFGSSPISHLRTSGGSGGFWGTLVVEMDASEGSSKWGIIGRVVCVMAGGGPGCWGA